MGSTSSTATRTRGRQPAVVALRPGEVLDNELFVVTVATFPVAVYRILERTGSVTRADEDTPRHRYAWPSANAFHAGAVPYHLDWVLAEGYGRFRDTAWWQALRAGVPRKQPEHRRHLRRVVGGLAQGSHPLILSAARSRTPLAAGSGPPRFDPAGDHGRADRVGRWSGSGCSDRVAA